MKPRNLTIHPCCPKRLVTALRRAKGANGKGWNFSALAKTTLVNRGTIYKLVVYGIEPQKPEYRLRLFLPKHPHKRVGDCDYCGKRVQVLKDGTLESHTHPAGVICPRSNSRKFLHAKKIAKKEKTEVLPPHRVWWNKLHPDYKNGIIYNAYLKTKTP